MNILKILLFLSLTVSFSSAYAEEYQSNDAFLNQTFNNSIPKPKLFWVSKEIKPIVEKILQHKAGFLRTRYWQDDSKSVWILDEIGKIKPITVAVIVEQHKIKQLKVLAFRESRGWEVKHAFFTDQFKDLSLNEALRLSTPIDGISGATLSVRALNKIAQLALFFDQKINEEK